MKKVFIVLCIAVMTFCALTAYASKPSFIKDQEWEVLKLTNTERSDNGLIPLTTFKSLQNAAVTRSDETVKHFDHTRPDGSSFYTVLGENNISYLNTAENIAAGQTTPGAVVDGWMNSSGHRANILSKNAKHLAVGFTKTQSDYRYYWAQLFVGGCSTTSIAIEGETLRVSCNMHEDSYIPLENVKIEVLPDGRIQAAYDGKTAVSDNSSAQAPAPVPGNGFADVAQNAWYKQYVDYTVANGMFEGTSATTFSPDSNITRAQFVQVLANLEGVDTSNREVTTKFTDVPRGKWFTAAVKWASENGVVNGVGDGKFDPNANVTREQMCVMLVNFAKFKGLSLNNVEAKASFADDAKISSWAKTAVYTCQQADIVNGKGANTFDPQGTGTRAEASVMFTKFHKDYIA